MPPNITNRRRIRNQQVPPPAPVNPLNNQVFYAKFRASFTVLAQSMNTQNNQKVVAPANPIVNMTATRFQDFTWMNPLVIIGYNSDKDQ